MVKLKVRCIACGIIEISRDLATLNVYKDELAPAYYEFTCPKCGVHNEKWADDEVRSLLVIADVTIHIHSVPQEALEEHDGDPISSDDLIDFMQGDFDVALNELVDPNV